MGRKAHSLPSCQSYKFTSHCKSQAGYSSPHVPLTWVALQATLHPWICFQTLLLVIKSQTQGNQSTNNETTNQTALLLAEAPVQSFLTVVSTFLDYTHRNPSLLTYILQVQIFSVYWAEHSVTQLITAYLEQHFRLHLDLCKHSHQGISLTPQC